MMAVEGELLTEVVPNLTHDAIAELYQLSKLDCIITQNGVRLFQLLGSSQTSC
jgi:NAD-dependent SIR2 family protein deacetylase